jgi:hypothetical protein
VKEHPPEPVKVKGLLAYVDQVHDSLPETAAKDLLAPDSTTVSGKGSPQEIRDTVRTLMQFAHPGEVTLKLTLNSGGLASCPGCSSEEG